MIIIGAGMSGLIAGSVLRQACENIIEAQDSLPANHSAVLRFKSSIIGDTTNIPFRKVKALKSVVPWKNPVADAMAYSLKSNGNYQLRSIASADNKIVERWVAPPNFTEQLASSIHCPIRFNQRASRDFFIAKRATPIISTLPMPMLMDILGYDGERPEFKSISGINITARIKNCDMHCSLYIPNPDIAPYRISVNGDIMIAEVSLVTEEQEELVRYGSLNSSEQIQETINTWRRQAFDALGIKESQTTDHSFARQKFQKILPIDESIRRKFIIYATDLFGVYSLGRFSTWRVNLLLDDIVNDVRIINHMIKHSNYEQKRVLGFHN